MSRELGEQKIKKKDVKGKGKMGRVSHFFPLSRQEKAEEPKEKVGRAVIAAKREEVARLQKLLVQV